MIFTRDFVTHENHCRIASLVTIKSLFTVTHALFFISLAVYGSSISTVMLLPLGTRDIMFSGCPSVCPSVRSQKYPLSTYTWVCWSIRPTVTVLWHIRPSVHPERFLSICRRTQGGNGLKFCMLMYLDHLQKSLDYGLGLLIFLLLVPLLLSETGQIWGFQAFPGEHIEGIAWNIAYWFILTTFKINKFIVMVCWVFLLWYYFNLVKQVEFGVSRHFVENPLRKWLEILHADVSWSPSGLIRLWSQFLDFSNYGAILT